MKKFFITTFFLFLTSTTIFSQTTKEVFNAKNIKNSLEISSEIDSTGIKFNFTDEGIAQSLKNTANKNNLDTKFEYEYLPELGVSTWRIDYNNDGDFLDLNETTNRITLSLVDHKFEYIQLIMGGNSEKPIKVKDFTINDVNFGDYVVNNLNTRFFKDNSGKYSNVKITGEFILSDSKSNPINNQLAFQIGLGDSVIN